MEHQLSSILEPKCMLMKKQQNALGWPSKSSLNGVHKLARNPMASNRHRLIFNQLHHKLILIKLIHMLLLNLIHMQLKLRHLLAHINMLTMRLQNRLGCQDKNNQHGVQVVDGLRRLLQREDGLLKTSLNGVAVQDQDNKLHSMHLHLTLSTMLQPLNNMVLQLWILMQLMQMFKKMTLSSLGRLLPVRMKLRKDGLQVKNSQPGDKQDEN